MSFWTESVCASGLAGQPLSRAAAAINNQGFLMPLHTEPTLTMSMVGERVKRNKVTAMWVA